MNSSALIKMGMLALAFIPILHAGEGHAGNLVSNGSFEAPSFTGAFYFLPAGSTAIPGWTVVGGEIHLNNDDYINLPAALGNQYAEITGVVGFGKGVLSDILPTTPGNVYELSFQLGAFNVGGSSFGNAAVDVAFNGDPAATFINYNYLTSNGTDWERIRINYTADSLQTQIRLTGSSAGSALGIGIDDVQFVLIGQSLQPNVPGPLPFLGIGVAFRCSRKLRGLIRSSL